MKTRWSTFFHACTLIIAFNVLSAQNCPTSLTFTAQSQVDSFRFHYPGCSSLYWLTLIGSDINSLDSLYVINELTVLEMHDTEVASLHGMHNISSMGALVCFDNENLSSIAAFNETSWEPDAAIILANCGLTTLSGLENLNSAYIELYHLKHLTDISALSGLTSVHYIFGISGCNSLTSLHGLDNLTYASELWLVNNDHLSSLAGLNQLSEVYALHIDNCDALTSLEGLNNLTSFGGLTINNCDLLSSCAIEPICNHLGYLIVSNNAPGCNSVSEIDSICMILDAAIAGRGKSVLISTDSIEADSSALLEVRSTTQGFLLPRMSSAQRNAIVDPAEGLLVYDTELHGVYFFDGNQWVQMGTAVPAPVVAISNQPEAFSSPPANANVSIMHQTFDQRLADAKKFLLERHQKPRN